VAEIEELQAAALDDDAARRALMRGLVEEEAALDARALAGVEVH